jgi:pyrroloquinoline-quinone synthase
MKAPFRKPGSDPVFSPQILSILSHSCLLKGHIPELYLLIFKFNFKHRISTERKIMEFALTIKLMKVYLSFKSSNMNKTFNETLEKHSLLKHPFYISWNEGTLTREQLALYATEYGSFIKLISEGWARIGEEKIATEEVEHFEIWKGFAASLGTNTISAQINSVKHLVSITQSNYSTYPGALGSLYAFEAQQPATASSKLEGLKKHYKNWGADETYFEIHSTDWEEPALLEAKILTLSEEDRELALQACTSTCKALWEALSGIMEARNN